MGCYHPKIRYFSQEEGWKICAGTQQNLEGMELSGTEYQLIPCQQCIGCRSDYAKTWAARCMLEASDHACNEFVTITYAQDSEDRLLHYKDTSADPKRREIYGEDILREDCGGSGFLSLIPEDLTRFIKSVRQNWKRTYDESGIKFYACGEYGSNPGYDYRNKITGSPRPHYHIIFFGLNIRDKYLWGKSAQGHCIWRSPMLEKCWSEIQPDGSMKQIGMVTIEDVTYESCAYVAGYVMKKLKGKEGKRVYESAGICPEFVRMSRRPGIAAAWYARNKDNLYKQDCITLPEGKKIRTPRYMDEQYRKELGFPTLAEMEHWQPSADQPEIAASIAAIKEVKAKRKAHMDQVWEEMKVATSKTPFAQLSAKEEIHKAKLKPRNQL